MAINGTEMNGGNTVNPHRNAHLGRKLQIFSIELFISLYIGTATGEQQYVHDCACVSKCVMHSCLVPVSASA